MRKRYFSKILLVMIACIIAYIFLVPLMFMVFTSFKELAEAMTSSSLLPRKWTIANYEELFSDTSNAPIFRWLLNTLIVTVCGTALRITTSVLAAYSMARLPLKGKQFFVVLVICSMAIPEIVTYFPMFYIFKQTGMLDTLLPLILPSGSGVMCIYLIYTFLQDFPKELEEAARMEGANSFRILNVIVLPSIKPIVITQSFVTFLGLYNGYLWPSLVINNQRQRTITLGIASLVEGENYSNPGEMMAATMIAVIPVIIIFMFANKYIVKGFSRSGIK